MDYILKSKSILWRLNRNKNYEIHCQIKGNKLYNILKLNKNEFVVYEDNLVNCLATISFNE